MEDKKYIVQIWDEGDEHDPDVLPGWAAISSPLPKEEAEEQLATYLEKGESKARIVPVRIEPKKPNQ